MADVLNLAALRRRITIELPDGSVHAIAPYTGEAITLLRQYREEGDAAVRATTLADLVRRALPTATEDQLDDTAPEDWARIVGAARGYSDIVELALGNAGSDGELLTPSPSADSNTTTLSPPLSPV